MKRTGPTNVELRSLIDELREKSREDKVNLWKRVAVDLERPSRIRRAVNLFRINRFTKEDEIALIPGKVLANGELDRKITIAAFNFSRSALDKINKSGSKAITIKELMKNSPKGKKIRIIG